MGQLKLDSKNAILFKADGTTLQIQPENGQDFQIEELYKRLDCQMVEAISINSADYLMLGDEEAGLVDSPVTNKNATEFYRNCWSIGDPEKAWQAHLEAYENTNVIVIADPNREPFSIVGDVILCCESMWQ